MTALHAAENGRAGVDLQAGRELPREDPALSSERTSEGVPVPLPVTNRPERTLLRDQVQERIRSAILDGTLRPGERLHDQELIDWLQVSRTPIREALTALINEGLIEMVPNRYTRVVEPTVEDARNAIAALGVLLASIIRITLPTITDQQRQSVIDRIDRRLAELSTGGTRAIARNVDEGYQAWLDLCPNRALADVVRNGARGLAYAYRVDSIEEVLPAGPLIARLRVYRDALAQCDVEAAARTIETAHTPRSPRGATREADAGAERLETGTPMPVPV